MFATPPASLSEKAFITTFGGVYEHSAWIAKQAWNQGLDSSHDTAEGLATILSDIVDTATTQLKLDLILAHPDLAGRAAQAGELTAESSTEQSGAGIELCSAEEFDQFQRFNQAYHTKFGFPFIMAVKGANRHQILKSFEQRLANNYEAEFAQAIHQIHKIARFRLEHIAQNSEQSGQET